VHVPYRNKRDASLILYKLTSPPMFVYFIYGLFKYTELLRLYGFERYMGRLVDEDVRSDVKRSSPSERTVSLGTGI
jgi:hypothetical protein